MYKANRGTSETQKRRNAETPKRRNCETLTRRHAEPKRVFRTEFCGRLFLGSLLKSSLVFLTTMEAALKRSLPGLWDSAKAKAKPNALRGTSCGCACVQRFKTNIELRTMSGRLELSNSDKPATRSQRQSSTGTCIYLLPKRTRLGSGQVARYPVYQRENRLCQPDLDFFFRLSSCSQHLELSLGCQARIS